MKLPQKLISFIASRTLTLWLIGLFIVYYLTVAVWSKEAFATFIFSLGNHALFRLLYVIFFLNVTYRASAALKRCWPYKLRFFLLLPLYLGLVILLFSLFMSVNIRKTQWSQPLGEGDPVQIPWEDEPLQIVQVDPALKKKALRAEGSAIFDYEPVVTLQNAAGERFRVGAFPPARVLSSYIHVLQFGIGPGVELKKNGEVVSRGYVALRLTPFGVVDNFELQPYHYQFYVGIIPNGSIKKGREIARDYDLEKPRYHLEVVAGDSTIYAGDVETGSDTAFDGRMTLRFMTPSDWVLLDIVYDPFLLWFAAGILLLLAGSLLYPLTLLTHAPRV
jgi:hypothetical protein